MALWVCRSCGCEFAVGLRMCPQCTSEDAYEKGSDMPKISAAAGATNADLDEGGEQPSPGRSSSTSTPSSLTPPSGETTSNPSPAPTTGNRTGKAQTGSSTARSTGTGQARGKGRR